MTGMPKKDRVAPFVPLKTDSKEFQKIYLSVRKVVARHFGDCPGLNVDLETHRFMGTYETVMSDFWNEKQGKEPLEDLKRAVLALEVAYGSLPWLLAAELEGNAGFIDDQKRDKFLEECPQDIIFSSQLPQPECKAAIDALGVLATRHKAAIEAIEMTLASVPEGIPTRNRPIQDWAIIEAAADLARAVGAFDVPKAIDETGAFYRLLCSLVDAFGYAERKCLKGVYAGWRKHMDGKYENFDLLDI